MVRNVSPTPELDGPYMMELLTPENGIALLTLTAMEVVLGIDNIIFIAILTGKLPKEQQAKARQLGIGLAVITRLMLLFGISWVMGLTKPLFGIGSVEFTGQKLILLIGGLFLLAKATYEIHHKMEEAAHDAAATAAKVAASFATVIVQILVLDLVFSLDSVITAVGMVKHIEIMVAAVLISVAVMLAFAGSVSSFVERHPTVKILALSFLLMIGLMLTAEGLGSHIEKGYIYFAMGFSFFVEMINLRISAKRKKHEAVVA